MSISVYRLKPAFVALLRPFARGLAAAGVTANQVTAAACLLSLFYAALLACFPTAPLLWGLLLIRGTRSRTWSTAPLLWGLLPVCLFLRMALNALDGILAREHRQQSRPGAQLNEMGDVVADAALFAPLALLPGVPAALVACVIWLALLTEFAGALGLLIGASRRYDGPCGKSDRALLLGMAGLLLALPLPDGWQAGHILTAGLCLCAALMLKTVFNRLRAALAESAA